jgi:hypothetical protein
MDMDETPGPGVDTGLVRYLKWLVTTLTVTMIVGLVVLITLVVMRFNAPATVAMPETITLPEGVSARAVTRGPDWIGVVTDDDRFLVYAPDGTTLRQSVTIETD